MGTANGPQELQWAQRENRSQELQWAAPQCELILSTDIERFARSQDSVLRTHRKYMTSHKEVLS